ncbi:hypothetical protein ACNOYE_07685 [Nannocystaceae bacterium ST9]
MTRTSRLTALALALFACDGPTSTASDVEGRSLATKPGSTSTDASEPGEPSEPRPEQNDPDGPCHMAGLRCPSADLPRFAGQLDAAGWQRLHRLALERIVAVDFRSGRVQLVESCRLPGHYHEGAKAPQSPGRAWSADRLAFLPSEPSGCETATHFVAAFAIHDREGESEAIALPLPCPPLGSGKPRGCIGAGLDDDAREALARERWMAAEPMMRYSESQESALPVLVELAALLPIASSYALLAEHLRIVGAEPYGGCLWQADAELSAHALDPNFSTRYELARGRPRPQHELRDCATRPSLLTCFPDQFVPGEGGNCW